MERVSTSTGSVYVLLCKVNAKASPLITHVPDALAHGAEVRANCMVARIVLDENGLASGVTYLRDGLEHFQRARLVAWPVFDRDAAPASALGHQWVS